MAEIYSSRIEYLYLVYSYLKLWLYDTIDYYYAYAILYLPCHLFGTPVLHISKEPESESDSNDDSNKENIEYEIYICDLLLIFYDQKNKATYRTLNGLQLRPIINEGGRFFITDISKYFDNLDTIIIKYLKFDKDSKTGDKVHTKIIDVAKKYDIRNHQSCQMGVYL